MNKTCGFDFIETYIPPHFIPGTLTCVLTAAMATAANSQLEKSFEAFISVHND